MSMELSVLALKAATIAISAIDKVSGGMLDKAGSDVFDFLAKRFLGRLRLHECSPKRLEATILSEAGQDEHFRAELEKLVNQYLKIQSIYSVNQQTESGVNINVDENVGTVVGQQIDQRLFRR